MQPSLPLAGGSGITGIIILGAVLAIGAAVTYYIYSKRKRKITYKDTQNIENIK